MMQSEALPLPRAAACWIFSLALALRAGVVLTQSAWGTFFGGLIGSGDQLLYRLLAESLLAGQGWSLTGPLDASPSGFPFAAGPTAWVMPGYPVVVAACRLLFGDSVIAVELVQAAIGAGTCVLIARTTAGLFGARAGLIAGVLAAGFHELVLQPFGLYTEPVYTFLVAGALGSVVSAFTPATPSAKRLATAGAWFGLAALVRPQAMGAALGIAAVLGLIAVGRRSMAQLARAAAFVMAALVVVLPWGLRNGAVMGRFSMLSTESGWVLWLGNSPDYDRIAANLNYFGGYAPAGSILGTRTRLQETLGRTEIDIDAIYRRAAIRHIANNPRGVLTRAPSKLWNMWRPAYVGSSGRNLLVSWTIYPLLLLAALAGIIISIRIPAAWPIVVFLVLNVGFHAVATGAIRFRAPLWPALLPFAALTIERAWTALRPQR
jgi:4-amino-4-deoxy-L-arabinose transferase-like glycosyltransferase